jgi:hypothetical protein
MQFRKIAAAAGTALMAGMALAAPALAAMTVGDISTIPALENGEANFAVVIGGGAHAADVTAGANLGAFFAGFVGEEKTISGTTSSSVTGGIDLSTATAKLYYGSAINAARSTLTNTEFPGVLDPSLVAGVSGTEYKYEQILNIGSTPTLAYGRSGTSLDDSAAHINLGSTTGANYFYKADVVFTKSLNVSGSDVDSKTMILFGKEYTLGTGTELSGTVLTLYGKGDELSMAWQGDSITESATVGDATVEVTLRGVTSSSGADLEINGVTYTNQTSGSYISIGGTTVYVKSVSYYGTNNGAVVLRLGADKIKLQNGSKVMTGTDLAEMDGTLVTITSSFDEISKIEIAVFKPNAASDLIAEGEEWVDGIFGSFKFQFKGMNAGFDATTRETITVSSPSDNVASIQFTDRSGAAADIEIATNYWSSAAQTTTSLADGNLYNYTVLENETVSINDYTIINQDGVSYLVQFSGASFSATGTNTITLTNAITGTELAKPTFSTGANGQTATSANVIGGKTYTIMIASNTSDAETIRIAWNAAGTKVIYPTLKTQKGANIALAKPQNVTVTASDTGSTILIFPSGTDDTSPSQTSTVYFNSSANGTTVGDGIVNVTTGTSADTTAPYTIGSMDFNLTMKNASGTIMEIMPSATNSTAVLIREEKGKQGSEDKYNGIVIPITVEAASPYKIVLDANSPTLTGTYSSWGQTTDNYVTRALDVYGTLITRDTTGTGIITVSYPDTQAIGEVFVLGDEGVITSSGSDGTYREAVPITSDIAVLDDEVDATLKENKNLFVIGGPCVNLIAANLLELDTYTCAEESGIPTDSAIVQVFEDEYAVGKVAVLVAGWEKEETDLAARAIQTGALDDQETAKVTITGDSLDALTIE